MQAGLEKDRSRRLFASDAGVAVHVDCLLLTQAIQGAGQGRRPVDLVPLVLPYKGFFPQLLLNGVVAIQRHFQTLKGKQ